MKNVYDNGYSMLGSAKDLQKYLLNAINNADNDTSDLREMLDEIKDYNDDTIVLINYEAPMGYTLEYWSNDHIVDENNLEVNEEGEI